MSLVKIENNQPVTSSLQVAETFGIQHKNVMQSIRNLQEDIAKAEISALDKNTDISMFYQDTYQSKGNFKKYPMFYMNKDGWTLLVMGYQGRKATQFKLKYITQFNKMEKFIKEQTQPSLPQDYATALEQLAKQVRLNETLQIENEKLKQQTLPRVAEQTELLTDILYSTEEIALEIGYQSARALNQRMYEERVIYFSKKENIWLLYAPYKDRGLKDCSTKRKSQYWTEKGREFIKVRFMENKIKEEV